MSSQTDTPDAIVLVWPDLAKFRHFGKICEVLDNFWGFISFLEEFSTDYANFVCHWSSLHWCKWPYVGNNLAIWSHWFVPLSTKEIVYYYLQPPFPIATKVPTHRLITWFPSIIEENKMEWTTWKVLRDWVLSPLPRNPLCKTWAWVWQIGKIMCQQPSLLLFYQSSYILSSVELLLCRR